MTEREWWGVLVWALALITVSFAALSALAYWLVHH